MHALAQEEQFETPSELRPLLAGNAERAEHERLPDENVRALEAGNLFQSDGTGDGAVTEPRSQLPWIFSLSWRRPVSEGQPSLFAGSTDGNCGGPHSRHRLEVAVLPTRHRASSGSRFLLAAKPFVV